ncbi:YetF domain-containing protein [Paenibacillus sp. S150]|uniref:YetF domain-containing protein n=1 Tax=Paenibacillus sp. S150 TaxID=2749826 RepID=UPI001C5A1449|nr:YetF domain-containing protein [Paenibacillus sp. S150]MBW4085794.1 DUF421 domain-containing protein [Paenibacillus sp. S150]
MEANRNKICCTLDSSRPSAEGEGVFIIEEAEYALLEDSGRIFMLKKDAFRLANRQDLGLPLLSQAFPVELIMDGAVTEDNLKRHGLTREPPDYIKTRKSTGFPGFFVRTPSMGVIFRVKVPNGGWRAPTVSQGQGCPP